MTELITPIVEPPSRPQRIRLALKAARIWAAQTVAPLGWFVLAMTMVSSLLAITMGLIEFGIVAVFGAVILLIAVPYLIGNPPQQVALSLDQDRVTAGTAAVVRVDVTNDTRRVLLPGSVEVRFHDEILELPTPALRPRETVTAERRVETPQRGVFQVGPATTVRKDPLGLFRRSRTDQSVRTLFVHPAAVSLPSSSIGLIRDLDGNPTATIVDADIAFHAIRPYMPGDAQRHIHWKSTAKTGDLMVKQFEETRRSRLTVLLGTTEAEFAGSDEFELAVSAVASLAARSIADGRETDVIVSPTVQESRTADERRVRTLNTFSPRALRDALAALMFGQAVTTVEHLGSRAAQTRQNASLVAVVVGSPVSFQQMRKATLPFGPDVQVVAISCDPETGPGVQRIGNLTVLRIGVLGDLQQLLLRGALA